MFLHAMMVNASQSSKPQAVAFICRREGGSGYHNGRQNQSNHHNGLTHKYSYIWHWLVNRGIPRREINKHSTKFLFDLYTWKSSMWNEKKNTNLEHQKQIIVTPKSTPRAEPVYRPRAL